MASEIASAPAGPLQGAAPASGGPAVPACPTCGAKRTRPDSTLCAYCATPFDLVAPRKADASANQARLARMKDQPGYDEAFDWRPLESLEYQDLERRGQRGLVAIVAGVAIAGTAALGAPAWLYAAGAALVALGVWAAATARAGKARILKLPLLVRPAIVLDRRSETAMGFWDGRTVYFFTMELGDGSDGEFRWPGRGADHQPLVNGATGLAFTRGDVLLGFRAIRV